ncbi:acyltransferase [Pseudarthrobacter sp. NPDC058329]|uniref:acyltransferase n=1 Tax=Pseudarthrobacter sp. NPDC058329 TaxID=3346448 RepID=UPI0036D9F585
MRLVILLAGILPSSVFKNKILRMLGFDIHISADIQPCLIINVGHISAGPSSRIGALTCIRGIRRLILEDSARIGQLNWISAAPDLTMETKSGILQIGAHSAITNRHYLDCSGGINLGSHTTVAGVRSTFITHGINWKRSEQSVSSIEIGSYCIISSNVNVTPGTRLPDNSVVGMGVTIDKGLSKEGGLVVSHRGVLVKGDLVGDYFTRTSGVVKPPADADAIGSSHQ